MYKTGRYYSTVLLTVTTSVDMRPSKFFNRGETILQKFGNRYFSM